MFSTPLFQRSKFILLASLFLLATIFLVSASTTMSADGWREKISPNLIAALDANEQATFIVVMGTQATTASSRSFESKAERGAFVVNTLQATAARSQAGIKAQLDAVGVGYRSYWIANYLVVTADLSTVELLAQRADVAHILNDPWIKQSLAMPSFHAGNAAPTTIEWGINMVNAPLAWDMGITGDGITVAGADTGYDWDHPGLINQYRGWDGASADHNFHWHDSIHENNPNTGAGNPCGFDSVVPCDDNGHGTHTMGTMVGNDMDSSDPAWPAGATNAVGVAPGADWISCRNMEEGWGKPSTYMECYEWFIAPTDLNGDNANAAMAPHVINNSWGCPASEGCDTDAINLMSTVVTNVRNAGILVVSSAGNAGSGCSTVQTPSAFFDNVFSIGSTTSADNISGFSSRGPSTLTGNMKPDVSAPGSSVRSTVPGTGYSIFSGTSMAAPHTAGVTALLLEMFPSLQGDPDAIEMSIIGGAMPKTSSQTCDGVPGSEIPNNTFGHGRIDVIQSIANGLDESLYLPTTSSNPD